MSCIHFRLHKQVLYGQAVYLILAEDDWSLQKARRMKFVKNSLWSIELSTNRHNFQYKYIISEYDQFDMNKATWENGLNRYCRNQTGTNKTINDRWNMRNVKIVLSGLKAKDDKVILIGSYSNIQITNQMSPIVYNNQDLHIAKFVVHIDDLKSLKFQYYVQKKVKQVEKDLFLDVSNTMDKCDKSTINQCSNNNNNNKPFNEYISTEFSINYSQLQNYEMVKIKFARIK